MTKTERERLEQLRRSGISPRSIAEELHIPLETIRTYCKRHPLQESADYCPVCAKRLVHTAHRRKKRFCSDSCRRAWWKAHPEALKRKQPYHCVCHNCGTAFDTHRPEASFCSMACYNEFRRREAGAWIESLHSES